MTQENKLRKEWRECWRGNPEDMPPIMEKIADWWLSKLSLALEADRKVRGEHFKNVLEAQGREILGVIEGMSADSEVDNTVGFRVAKAMARTAIEAVIGKNK